MERTLIIIKPDGVQRGLIGEIITRFEQSGLRLAAMKFMQITPELAARHYAVHEGKHFYKGLIRYITSAPVVIMAWEGLNAIERARQLMGKTNPLQAEVGSIRGTFGISIGRNLVHGSDGPDTAAFELGLFFTPGEFVSWERCTDEWIFEEN